MKYHNFKRPLAVILASLLTFSSASFVASAQDVEEETQGNTTITYTFRGGSSNGDGTGDYVVEVLANGGLINTGYVELDYDADLYSDASFTFANNIKDASFYWNVKESEGKIGVGFMSAAGLTDKDAGLFADIDNPSENIAYIDASGSNLVKIGTFTFTFADGNTYATAFTTDNAANSVVEVESAKYILHETDGYDTTQYDAEEIDISNIKVFSADDFELAGLETIYTGEAQNPTVTSDVADFTLALGDANATEVTNAGKYAIKVVDVSGDGYYDAAEIDLGVDFIIGKKTVEIEAPVADPAEDEYVVNGFNPADIDLSSDDWEVTDTDFLDAGKYNVNVKYVGKFDTDNNIYKFNGEEVTNKDAIVATVAFEVTKAEGEVPALTTTYAATYDSKVAQTVAGYEIALSKDWAWVDSSTELAIGANANIAVKFTPTAEQLKNYTFDGYDEELGYVPGTVTVTLNKATGTAPELPTVDTADQRRDSLEDVIKASDVVTAAGVWSYTDAELVTGDNTITFTYKPTDLDKVNYEGLENWNAETEQFEYSVTVKVLAPYFVPTGIYPPANPAAKTFEEGVTYTTEHFSLEDGWGYAENEIKITTAGTVEDVKILYPIPAGYDGLSPEYEYQVEGNYIVYYVDLTVNKGNISVQNIKFEQSSVYTGSAIALETSNITVTGLTGVTAANVTLVAVKDVNVGTYDVYATVAETTNYNAITEAVVIGTLEITAAPVTADMFTVSDNEYIFDGVNKSATVAPNKDGLKAPETIKYYLNDEEITPRGVGEYVIKVSAAAEGNYQAYTDLEVGKLTISKDTITINKPADPEAVYYAEGGIDVTSLKFTDWEVTDTGVVGAGTHTINIKYTGTLDAANYDYVAGEGVTKTENVFTATVSFTVNKIAGTVAAPTATQSVTFDSTKADKLVTTYVTSFGDGWTIVDATKTLAYGDNAITVQHTADTENYTWEDYIVGEGVITATVNVTFNKAVIETKVPPVLAEGTNNKTFVEAGYKYSDFVIATEGWVYDTPDAAITSATTVNATVKYEIGEDYKVADSTWIVEEGYIVAEVALTVVKAKLPEDAAVATKVETVYNGDAKTVTVTANEGYTGLGLFEVTYEGNTNAGTYDVYVTFADGTNYKGGTITLADYLVIEKANVTKDMFTVTNNEYTYDGNTKSATVTANDGVGAPTVTYNPAEVKNAGEYAIIVAGDETANYNAYSNITLDTKLEITAVTLSAEDFAVDANDFTYNGTAQKATASTKVQLEGVGTITTTYKQGETVVAEPTNAGIYDVYVTVAAGDNYEALGETYVGSYAIKKAALPEDAAIVTDKTTEYTGSNITVDVVKNDAYNGLGEFNVAYPEGNIDAGTYDVTVTFSDGDNYFGGTLTFEDVLVINKKKLSSIDTPVIAEEMTVGTTLTGEADNNDWSYVTTTIVEGENTVTVTKTIVGSFAKNYDYSEAAEKAGVTLTINETTFDVTLTKTYTVIGKLATGTISFTALAIEGETGTNDITVTLISEDGEAIKLDVTEDGHIYSKEGYELTEGKYTLKIKKIKYLEAVINFELEGGENLVLPNVTLIPGDIVGGPEGNETMGDGVIDIDDFVIAIRAFDTASSDAVKVAADIDGDGNNNVTDLGYIKANFNKTTANCTITIE